MLAGGRSAPDPLPFAGSSWHSHRHRHRHRRRPDTDLRGTRSGRGGTTTGRLAPHGFAVEVGEALASPLFLQLDVPPGHSHGLAAPAAKAAVLDAGEVAFAHVDGQWQGQAAACSQVPTPTAGITAESLVHALPVTSDGLLITSSPGAEGRFLVR